MKKLLAAAGLLCFPFIAVATKAPWLWSDEERLSLRFSPEAIRERTLRYHERRNNLSTKSEERPVDENIIDGSMNPELFLPWELFQHLILAGFDMDRDVQNFVRSQYASRATWMFETRPNFWAEIEALSNEYRVGLAEADRLSQRLRVAEASERQDIAARLEEISRKNCARRASSLAAAYEIFSKTTLNEFLYSAVAPAIVSAAAGIEAPDEQRLRFIARGCK